MPVTESPIAYAGEPGAFAEDAVLAAFGDVPRTPLGTFRAVFEAVTTGTAAAGVVPIENVINGTVRENIAYGKPGATQTSHKKSQRLPRTPFKAFPLREGRDHERQILGLS